MKKTIALLLSVAGMAVGDITIEPFISDTYGSWTKTEGIISPEDNTYDVGENEPNWAVYTSTYTLNKTYTLTQNEVLTFSYDILNRGTGNSVVTLALVGSQQAIVTGHGTYSSPANQIQAGVSSNVTTAQGYIFSSCNDNSIQQMSAGATLDNALPVGETSTISGSIRWTGSSYTLTLTSSALTDVSVDYVLSDVSSLDLSAIVLTFDGGKQSSTDESWHTPVVSNLAVSIIPEPTTATLSLLALAGLAARRRRR